MLYTSGHNLESSAITFLDLNENTTLFTAYLKVDELKKINFKKSIKRIIVRWEIKDLCLGVSDLSLFDYCKEHNIALYRNTRLHLKAFWNSQERILFGSANITNRGLGENGEFNYELNGQMDNVDFLTSQYLFKIILESEYVTDDLYQKINFLVENSTISEEPEVKYGELKSEKGKHENFLLSDLPMSRNFEVLYNTYLWPETARGEDRASAAHDLALYKIPSGLNIGEFEKIIKVQFNAHPFIKRFKQSIIEKKSCHYGGVVKWIQENTTTVPTPRSWEVKREQIVNILFEWICFYDSRFNWSRPNHSQVIYYEETNSSDFSTN